MSPQVLILHAPGTNRDREAAWACSMAGATPEIVRVEQLVTGERRLDDYRMLVLPGGFSYGDDLGAGKVWASRLLATLQQPLLDFVASGRPVLGICNGFQALVKTGLLPGALDDGGRPVTLTHNDSDRFECRWVTLEPNPNSPCVFTRGLREPILCPVAHGEGKLVVRDQAAAQALADGQLAALRYSVSEHSAPRDQGVPYPHNPNGSHDNIAGLTNPAGNVLGLMPHPEDHIVARQHPRVHRGEAGNLGLALFQAGVDYASKV